MTSDDYPFWDYEDFKSYDFDEFLEMFEEKYPERPEPESTDEADWEVGF